MSHRSISIVSFLAISSLVLFCYACKPGEDVQPEKQAQPGIEALTERATEFWQHRINKDLDKAYAFEYPDSVKDFSLTQYVKSIGGGVTWHGAEVDSIKMAPDGNSAEVTMTISYLWNFARASDHPVLQSKLVEKWQLHDGDWYHVYKKPFKSSRDLKLPPPEFKSPATDAETSEVPVNDGSIQEDAPAPSAEEAPPSAEEIPGGD